MNDRMPVLAPSVVLAIAWALTSSISIAFAQTPPREKPKLKNFGSSLKRLKWDTNANASVETKRRDAKPAGGDEIDVVRVETSLVVCDVLIINERGQSVQGLTEKDFVLAEDGKPQEVGMFSSGDDAKVPRSIVLLIDYSGSQLPFINTSIAAAKTLVDKLRPLDTMAIVTDDVELLQDFTRDKGKLKDDLESLRRLSTFSWDRDSGWQRHFGKSKQYSALMATLREAFDREDLRPIIIFQTDGDEAPYLQNLVIVPGIPPNLRLDLKKEAEQGAKRMKKAQQSRQCEFSLTDIYRAAEKSRATIYTVVPGIRLLGLSPDEQVKQMIADVELRMRSTSAIFNRRALEQSRKREEDSLKRTPPEALKYWADEAYKVQSALAAVATSSGGWTSFLEDPAQADEIYSRIFSDINRRYIVGFYPTNKDRDGKRRAVKIEVRGHPEYIVIGRKSYYAPEPDQ